MSNDIPAHSGPPARSGASASAVSDGIEFPEVDLRHRTLPNGLNVLVKEDRSAPVASIQAWCMTGSIHEDAWLGAGLSHILEHMLFKGTASRSTSEIAEAVQDAGGYMNAYTSFDRTVYWIDAPAEGVTTAIDVLADVMTNATIPEEEYEKEQEVIRREFAMGFDDPDRMSSQLMFATAFQKHPYGIPVIGHLDVYNKLTRDDVLAYYERHYVPNNMFFVVVGDVDADAVHAQLAKLFEDCPRKALKPVYIPPEPAQLGRRHVHKEFATQLAKLSLTWSIPDLTHPDMPALDLLATILGEGRSSRLYIRIRDELKLAHSVDAYSYTPAFGGLFAVTADMDAGRRDAVESEVLRMIEELKEEGVTPEELEKARKMTLSAQLGMLTTMRGQASDIGSNWLLTRNVNFTRDYLAAIQRVGREDIADVARRYLVDSRLCSTSLNPTGSLGQENRDVAASSVPEIERFVLENGLTLLVRRDPRLPLVSMGATFRGGLLAETPEDNGITILATRLLLKGTGTRSAEEIADAIESVGGSIGATSGNNSLAVTVHVMQPDLELGLDVLSDVVLHPAFPPEAVEREKEAQIAAIQEEDDRVMTVASKAMRRALFDGHPFACSRNGTEASVSGIDRAQLLAFHTKYAVARNCVVTVYGNVDADEARRLVEAKLSPMPQGERPFEEATLPRVLEESVRVEEFRNKQQAVIVVGYRSSDLRDEDRDALDLLDEACSDMASRFFIRIREELGLAYYVGTTQVLGLAPGAFIFYVGTDPAKVDLVERELLGEIARLASDGLTEKELARARKTYLGKQKIEMQSNGAFAQMTALDELYGLGFGNYRRSFEKIGSLTVEDMRAIARKYLLDKPSVLVRVMPDDEASASPS